MTDWKEEAFRVFAARWVEEETEWRKNNPGKVKAYLENASDEPSTFSFEGQANLRNVIAALNGNGIEFDAPVIALDSADAVGGYTGEIAVLATAFGPVLTGILAAWLQSKAGRKIRVKDGDIEVEARTIEEVRKGFDVIAQQRAKYQRKEDK